MSLKKIKKDLEELMCTIGRLLDDVAKIRIELELIKGSEEEND